ncbi:hypothetical protein RB195_021590 [Necator americanus]|uniref:Uncharacterized protein n=1 Tax=Necator americanus TaxID=51031 RepID=A0ABR1ECU1_NECAM
MGLKFILILAISLSANALFLSTLGDFLNIVHQHSKGNKIEQCPCVIHPASGKCIVYDPRYQAATLEEAMHTFLDLTSPPDPQLDVVAYTCTTVECQHCFGLLYYHLLDIGVINKDFRPVTHALPRYMLQKNLCPRYRFLKHINIPPLPQLIPPHVRTMIINGLQRAGIPLPEGIATETFMDRIGQFGPEQPQQQHQISPTSQQNGGLGFVGGWMWNPQTGQWQQSAFENGEDKSMHVPPADNFMPGNFIPPQVPLGGYGKRKKRAAKQAIVGSRFIIGCSNRGESDDSLLALCGSCWAWRELPEDYFPRLLNELSCKENDFCLSGWGECVQQFRNVDILRKVGGQWQSAALSVATCCDCRVRAGTEVHSLVVGDRNNIALV